MTIPKELEESAYLELAAVFKTFSLIVIPIAKPALGTAAVLEFLVAWNEFQFALTLTASNSNRTLPIALYYFKASSPAITGDVRRDHSGDYSKHYRLYRFTGAGSFWTFRRSCQGLKSFFGEISQKGMPPVCSRN